MAATRAVLMCLGVLVSTEASFVHEANMLVQSTVRTHAAEPIEVLDDDDVEEEVVLAVDASPIVYTELGPIKGVHEKGYDVFRNIPYAEPPERFDQPVAKKTWGARPINAQKFGAACIGSGIEAEESEDCLKLHVWRPKGKTSNLPVIVYFHGGMNQHGSGQEKIRHGDGIVQSTEHPTIFVGMDFRLGIFGWVHASNDTNVTNNLGLLDQQEALRFVKKNVAAFGGDPERVTLQGQSEGAHNILAHMVAPGSAGLFQRVVLHSPAADIWSRRTNHERTNSMVYRLNCLHPSHTKVLDCLRAVPAQKLWEADWFYEDMSGENGKPKQVAALGGYNVFMRGENTTVPGYLGWNPVADGVVVPGEPRALIPEGKWNKVPVLITMTKNESMGIYGTGDPYTKLKNGLTTLLKKDDLHGQRMIYNMSLINSNIWIYDEVNMMHMMITDKMWTCDIKSLADDILKGGGQAFVGVFAHEPKYDPSGELKNKACVQGAACHAADMLYILPQGRDAGIHGKGMEDEVAFSQRYSEDFLTFVYGEAGPWVPYDKETQAMTYYETKGPRVVPKFKNNQCHWLDTSVGKALPEFMTMAGFWKWVDLLIGKKLRDASEGVDFHALWKAKAAKKPPPIIGAAEKVVEEVGERAKKALGVAKLVGGKVVETATKAALDHMLLG